MNQWIDAKEQLPPEDEAVIAVNMNGSDPEPFKSEFIQHSYFLKDRWITPSGPLTEREVTHWMRLPEMPKRSRTK